MPIAAAHIRTPEGHAALLKAAAEAALHRTQLIVLQVVEGNEAQLPSAQAEAARSEIARELAGAGVDDLDWTVRLAGDGGNTAAALVGLAIEVEAELLVLGSRRRSAVGKFLLGSTVQRIVLDAPMPVFVVKAPQR